MQGSCEKCLYHLPDAEDHVCVCEESPKYNTLTYDDDSCEFFRERVNGEV